MSRLQSRPPPHGFTLLLVLGLISVLMIAAAALLLRSESQSIATGGVVTEQVAATRAEQAAQLALGLVRSGSLNSQLATLSAAGMALSTVVEDHGQGTPLAQGGGLIYDYTIRCTHPPPNLTLLIVARGYYGYAGSPSLNVAEVQIEYEFLNFMLVGTNSPLGYDTK